MLTHQSTNMVKVLSSSFEQGLARLTRYFSKGPFKQDFLDTYLTTFFGVRKFKNTAPMRVIFFLKMFKIDSKFRKCKKKEEKIFLGSEIVPSFNKRILVIGSQWVDKQS